MGRFLRAAPHNSARKLSERFYASSKFQKRGNTVCISCFSCSTGAVKDPLLSRRRFIQSFLRATPHNSARKLSERFCASSKFQKRGNTVCISRFWNCRNGTKDPLRSADAIVRCCLSSPNTNLSLSFPLLPTDGPYSCSLGRLYLPWGSHSGRGSRCMAPKIRSFRSG